MSLTPNVLDRVHAESGTFTGSWEIVYHELDYRKKHYESNNTGDKVSWSFSGDVIVIIVNKSGSGGIANVYVDAVKIGEIDTYNGTGKEYQIPFAFSGLGTADHTVEVEVSGTKNASSSGYWIEISGFQTSEQLKTTVDPGVAYVGGKRQSITSQQILTHSTPSADDRYDIIQLSPDGIITVKEGVESGGIPSPDANNYKIAECLVRVGYNTITRITDCNKLVPRQLSRKYGFVSFTRTIPANDYIGESYTIEFATPFTVLYLPEAHISLLNNFDKVKIIDPGWIGGYLWPGGFTVTFSLYNTTASSISVDFSLDWQAIGVD